MQLVHGGSTGVSFPVNAAEVTYRTLPVASQSGRPVRYVMRVDVKGTIDGSGQADLAAKELLFRAALLTPYGSLALVMDSGANSAITLLQNDSLSGTRIVDGPHFEDAQGPEHVTMRTVTFAMAAEFMAPGATNVLVRYFQSVSVIGTGGPTRVWRFPINAKPIRQIVKPYSLVRVVQRGEAVGHTAYPAAAAYLVDKDFLVNDGATVDKDTPKPLGSAWVEYPTRWNYVFELTTVPAVTIPLPAM